MVCGILDSSAQGFHHPNPIPGHTKRLNNPSPLGVVVSNAAADSDFSQTKGLDNT
jgi:hypothetical protein